MSKPGKGDDRWRANCDDQSYIGFDPVIAVIVSSERDLDRFCGLARISSPLHMESFHNSTFCATISVPQEEYWGNKCVGVGLRYGWRNLTALRDIYARCDHMTRRGAGRIHAQAKRASTFQGILYNLQMLP